MKRIAAIIAINDADTSLSDDAATAIKHAMGCGCCSTGQPVEVIAAHWTDDTAIEVLAFVALQRSDKLDELTQAIRLADKRMRRVIAAVLATGAPVDKQD